MAGWCAGCEATVAWQLRRAHHAEAALKEDQLDARTLLAALEGLQQDICPGTTVGTPQSEANAFTATIGSRLKRFYHQFPALTGGGPRIVSSRTRYDSVLRTLELMFLDDTCRF